MSVVTKRMVNLDLDSLNWALSVIRDNEVDVINRKQMSQDWQDKYTAAKTHIRDLITAAKRR